MSIYGFIINGKTERYTYDALNNAPITKGTGANSIIVENTDGPNIASGEGSFAGGNQTTASGTGSVTFGGNSIASGMTSFAGGAKSGSVDYPTTASGNYSFAYGLSAKAEGASSVALGQRPIASALGSVAMGNNVLATGRASLVIGQFNLADDNAEDSSYGAGARKYLFIVGNGTADDARSNAITVDWDGNVVASGKMTVGAAPSDDLDVATKKYVDDNLSAFQGNSENNFLSLHEKVDTVNGTALKAFNSATVTQASIVSLSPEYAAENVPVSITTSEASATKIYKTGANIASGQYESGIWNDSGVKEDAEKAVRSKDYIPVARNTTYYIAYSTYEVAKGFTFRKYGRNKNFIGSATITSQSRLLTTDANCYFVTWSTDPSGDNLEGIHISEEVYDDDELISGSEIDYTYSINDPPSINYPSTDETWHRHWEEVTDISQFSNEITMGSETTNFFCDYGDISVEYRVKPKEVNSEITVVVPSVVEEAVAWEDIYGVWHTTEPNTYELKSSKFYHFVSDNANIPISVLTIKLEALSLGMAHYHFDFDTGSTVPTITLPATVTMPSNFYLEANKHYEIDIFNNYGMVVTWTIS